MESISLGKDKLKKGIKEVKIASLIDDTPFNISVQRLPFYFVFTSFRLMLLITLQYSSY